MEKISKVLNREFDNHFLPFLWMHGESQQTIRDYLEKISQAGIKSVCLESRPYENFLKDQWWSDLAFIIEECNKLDMTFWILDDKHFPTGYAAGAVKNKYPHLRKLFLDTKSLDFVGPRQDAEIMLDWLTSERPNIMNVGTEGNSLTQHSENEAGGIVGIFAAKKTAYDEIDEATIVDLSEYTNQCTLFWDIPEGEWTIFALFTTYEGGEEATEGYLNPLVKEATQVLLDTVYEPHYRYFGKEFGKTIKGFFSDEPRFGNTKGPDAAIGRQEMPLPWTLGLELELAEKMGISKGKLLLKLLLLFTGSSDDAHAIRYHYMDLISKLYSENFSDVIGSWCKEHNVEYIGHVIEDNNAHARLGYGAGHFFRSMSGQHMSGIDVVLHQLMPRQNNGYFKSYTSKGWDGEFFSYGLAKLGSSLGQLDPIKQGRTMCEVYGAYGWSEGLRLMKWLTDHMLVNGVNYFVPHAFTMKKFPDPDCPPHFYAHGHNLQFPSMGTLIDYSNRISCLLSEGKYISSIGVLYHAEAEWSGESMLFQKPARVLTENQIGFTVIPSDMLIEHTLVGKSEFTINERSFNTLIIPFSEKLPIKLLHQLIELVDKGVSVIFIDDYPIATSENIFDGELFNKIRTGCKVSRLADLTESIGESADRLRLNVSSAYLRYYHYEQNDGEIFMLFNEDMYQSVELEIIFPTEQNLMGYNPVDNCLYTPVKVGEKYHIRLDRGETAIFYTGEAASKRLPEPEERTACVDLSRRKWSIEVAEGYGAPIRKNWHFDKLPKLTKMSEFRNFSGKLIYRTTFAAPAKNAFLRIQDASEVVTVRLNGKDVGTKIAYPYSFNLSNQLEDGNNELEIIVVNNLGRYMRDYLSQYLYLDPVGIEGEVMLEYR